MWNEHDKKMCENVIRSLKKGKFELDGLEVLAFAQMMAWVNNLHKKISDELDIPAILANAVNPINEEKVGKKKK